MTLVLTLVLAIGMFAPLGQAAPAAPTPGGRTPTGTPTGTPAGTAPAHLAPPPAIGVDRIDTAPARPDGKKQIGPEDLVPQSPTAPFTGLPTVEQPQAKAFGLGAAAAAQPCNVGDFTGRTGSALVQQIKSVDLQCINSLFVIGRGDAASAFRESQMITVAYAVRDAANGYQGNNSASISQLMLFLQAGYFVHYTYPDVVGSYGDSLKAAGRSALDAFFANPRSRDVTADNAGPLARATTLIDSIKDSGRYLPVIKRLLADYDSTTWNPTGMVWGLTPVLTALFAGHWEADYLPAVLADPTVLDTLFTFISRNHDLLGGDYGQMIYESVNELGRFMQYPELLSRLRPYIRTLAEQSAPSGPTLYQRGAAALAVRFYDAANCSYYGTCDDPAKFKAANLTVKYSCSPSIKIIAQALDNARLGTACTSLTGQDAFFHAEAKDGGPVKDDNNTTIEVVVFHSDLDYKVLAAVIYGIRTDNGGMYLEGDPATVGNQPRFLCYENKRVRPSFEIWNLNHEYTHYLDGRFDVYGDYDAGQVLPIDWWVEGFAEFVSYSYRKVVNDGAIAVASQHTYKLSELFDTVYATSSQDRVYRWGYLAVRYMLEQHRSDTDAVLAKYRAGDWDGARTILKTTIGTRYDADFDSWLTRCAAGACAADTPGEPQLPECTGTDTRQLDAGCVRSSVAATTGNYAHFYVWVPQGTKQLKVSSKGGTGNGDLYYNPGSWAYTNSYVTRSAGPDNWETLTVSNPPAGYVFFSLYAQQGFSGVSVTSEF
ncbi:M9 family metallopeptidase [Streptomyces sp. LS1784]|uniref:M9 family metallopeptidase n=1 Tax=Streptomyces sp. LS1784 TaxID=2851533 RepID=UPI001CCC1934|nr:M9 family metallopeptidase [Streptomyces sp. LS1784]